MKRLKVLLLQLAVVAAIVMAVNPQMVSLASEPTSLAVNAPQVSAQEEWIKGQLGDGLDVRDQVASGVVADQFVKQISAVEWLAPLAPVALSPFFGITLLSGLACYGPDWLPDNALLSAGSPLANPTMFWVFLIPVSYTHLTLPTKA